MYIAMVAVVAPHPLRVSFEPEPGIPEPRSTHYGRKTLKTPFWRHLRGGELSDEEPNECRESEAMLTHSFGVVRIAEEPHSEMMQTVVINRLVALLKLTFHTNYNHF